MPSATALHLVMFVSCPTSALSRVSVLVFDTLFVPLYSRVGGA